MLTAAQVGASNEDAQERNNEAGLTAICPPASGSGTWVASAGTIAEAITKATLEPEASASTPNIHTGTLGAKEEIGFTLTAALIEALEGSMVVQGVVVHMRWSIAVANSHLKMTLGVSSREVNLSGAGWEKIELTGSFTRKELEELRLTLEKNTNGKEVLVLQAYLEVIYTREFPAELTTATTLLVAGSSGNIQYWAAHFPGIAIPHNALILQALLSIWVPGPKRIMRAVVGYDSLANPSPFTATIRDISTQGSKATVSWSENLVEGWSTLDITSSVAAYITAVTGAGVSEGAAIVKLSAATGCECTIQNYDGSAEHAAKLEVIWREPRVLVPVTFRAVQRAATR